MTDKLAQEQETKEDESVGSEKVASARNNRRKLLKGAVAMPIVMTLNTAMAQQVARTSNMVGALQGTTEAELADAVRSTDGSLACFSVENSVSNDNGSISYDLGEPPMELPVNANSTVTEQAAECRTNNGIIVSTTAFNSITGGEIT